MPPQRRRRGKGAAAPSARAAPCQCPMPSALPIFNMPVPPLYRRRMRFSNSALLMPQRSSSALGRMRRHRELIIHELIEHCRPRKASSIIIEQDCLMYRRGSGLDTQTASRSRGMAIFSLRPFRPQSYSISPPSWSVILRFVSTLPNPLDWGGATIGGPPVSSHSR